MDNILIVDENRYQILNEMKPNPMLWANLYVIKQKDGKYKIVKSRYFEPGDIISKSLLDWILQNG